MPDQTTPEPGVGSTSGAPSARSSQDLIGAAAAGHPLTQDASDDLLTYFLSNDGLPGDDTPVTLTVDVGHGQNARKFECQVRQIEWAEREDAMERGTNTKTDKFDPYVVASWIVARALITPKLGPVVARKQAEDPDKAPADAAALLRHMFRRQSGALLDLSTKVLELSKLSSTGESTVREVEAGKR